MVADFEKNRGSIYGGSKQSFRLATNPGTDLKVVRQDLDQITQAVECPAGRRIVGVQWHPEYLLYLPSQFALFRWLLHDTG